MRDTSKVFAMAALVVSGIGVGTALALHSDTGSSSASGGPPCPGADGHPNRLRECLSSSVVFIETDIATGSGVVLANGYVVTNAHVVDPFASVDVTFDGGDTIEGVPVVGVDAFADIAVLGPIDAGTSAITLQPVGDIDEVGDGDVFLVGYPGEGPEDPHVALARGLLSRMRDDTTFDVTYVQTDAAIGGGQSGGALVDGEGRLLGISSASFAEAFALAVVTDDVLASFERIIDGDGDETNVIPDIDDAPDEPRSVDLTEAASTQLVVIPADDDDREITLDVGTSDDVAITVGNYVGDVFAWNDAARDLGEEFADDGGFTFDTSDGFDPFEGTDDLEETSPGTYVFSAPADQDLIVSLGRVDDVALLVEVNVPFDVLPVGIEGAQVEIGSSTRGVLDGFALSAIHTIELREGDEIEISLHAGTSDPYFTLVAPGEIYDDFSDPSGDDGGGGLYDLDADETFTIDESGTWQIVVSTYEALVAGYQLDVTRAG